MSPPGRHAVAARRVFDGLDMHDDAAIVIDGSRIAALVARRELPLGIAVVDLPDDACLAPGFIDIQVNGGGDALFNDAPTPDTIRTVVVAHRKLGTTALLPTLISDTADKMRAALEAVEATFGIEPGVLGIHLEGPFLSPDKAGVHDRRMFRKPTADDLAMITAARRGATLVTLAPEQVPTEFIAALRTAGVRIALGHSMATYAQTRSAIAAGLTGFTHLFNAMRPLDSREPGPIAAALEQPELYYGLIVDGLHVAPPMLRLALRGAGRPILVSDAMPLVGGAGASFTLYGETVFVRDGRCSRADGTLAGTCLDLGSAVRNCVRMLGVPLADALRMASVYPAEFLGLGDRLGKLAPGFRADLVALDAITLAVLDTWVAGSRTAKASPRPGPRN